MAYNRNYGNSFQSTTPVVLNLIIINVLVFLAQRFIGGNYEPNKAADLFALHHYKSDLFKPYQLITHMFMHGSFGHLFFNMLVLFMFGSLIERSWGPKRFLIFYIICGLAAGFAQLANYAINFRGVDQLVLNNDLYLQYQGVLQRAYTVGASGAIMGIFAAYAYLFPNTELIIFPIPMPIKAKYAVAIMAAIDLFGGVYPTYGGNIAHFAHLGGLVMGFILVIIWNKTNKKTFY
jgi:membrane associated rhomboid family serine protease